MSPGRHAFQTCICSLIGFNSYFVLYLMCCFGNNPLYMDKNDVLFCSVLHNVHFVCNLREQTVVKYVILVQ